MSTDKKLRVLEQVVFLCAMGLAELIPFGLAAVFGATWPVMAGGLASFALGMLVVRRPWRAP